jgi:hypothetical protein
MIIKKSAFVSTFFITPIRYFSSPHQILRINPLKGEMREDYFSYPQNEEDLKRIYLILAKMYHPDNQLSGKGSKANFQKF